MRFLIPFLLILATTLIHAEEDKVSYDISEYLPLSSENYWSYIGTLETDEFVTDVNFRREIDNSTLLDNKKSYRLTQEVIPSLSDSLEDVAFLNKREFVTSQNGWRMFREETQDGVAHFGRSALILPLQAKVSQSNKYKTRFDSEQGINGIVSYHTVVIGEEEIEIPNGTFTALKVNQEKKTKLAADEDLDEVTQTSVEYHSFWLLKGVGVVRQESDITSIDDGGSQSIKYEYDLVSTDYLPNYLWPEAETTPEGWKQVEWFGNLTDNYFPWIYHADHGWMFVDAQTTDDVRLWSESLGWWVTSEELYPTFYSLDLNDWVTFEESDDPVREFTRSDGTVITASINGFQFRPRSSKPAATTISDPGQRDGDQQFFDAFGNRYTDSTGGLTPDQGSLPTISIISPFQGLILDEGEPLLLFADAVDRDGTIENVRFIVNGRLVFIDEAAPYQTIFNPSPEEDTLEVTAIARDNHGNEQQADSVSVQVRLAEQFPPKVRVSYPLNKSYFKFGERVWVDLVATDSDGFVESVGLLVDGIQVEDEKSTPPYSFSFIPPVNGSYQISGFAIDDDLNESTATSIQITVNETGKAPSTTSFSPEVRITSPINKSEFNLGDTVTIQASAFDEDGSVTRLTISVDGVQVGPTFTSPPYSVSYTPPVAGSYTITATARDNELNQSTSSSVTFKVN